MKTIIAGSRDATFEDTMLAIHRCPWDITEIISGLCRGPDRHGLTHAKVEGIPFRTFPADWNPAHLNGKLDKSAGIKRNIQMAKNAEALIAVWDGKSNGTKHMIDEATKRGLEVFISYTTDELHNL